MPTALHPQAKFDPIPPDLDLQGLVERTRNFRWVQRVSRSQIRNLGSQEFEKLVQIHVIAGGKPLVIDGWDAALPKWLFDVDWLEKTYDKKQENVRDISAATDIPMTTGHYLRSMKQLTNQWTPHTYRDERRQRLYLKDIDCPLEWRDSLQKVIHPSLFYLNENVNATGGAGDLMSSLPEDMRAENLMCYIGHEGTFTPAHREMCASLGQNIMVEASVDGAGEKAGSSIWFMTESKDREVVREYFLSMLGHDIEIEKHFAQINAWKKAPFDVYIVEQRVGDFILIPPLAAHQVWNRGTRTMKVAWNRTTVETLDLALHEALPKARLVCRDEQYRNKAIIYFTLQKYCHEIVRNSPRARQLAGDFKRLFGLFTEVLVDETFAFKEKDVEFLPFDSCVTCSYCRSNIFNRFLTCKHCVRTLANGDEDAYDWPWSGLVDRYETWRSMVIANDGFIDIQISPQPFEVARLKSGKKTVAQICQEALRRRPWKDITKQDREKTPSDSEPGDGDEKAKKKPKRKKKKGEVRRCHVCCHKDYSYRVHQCTNPACSEGYCYGVLYRAFDMMPQKVLEDEYWQCPKCLGICSCGACRRSGNTNAYTPKSTLLGHDTRPIADDRSVEALVDFRVHNLSWLKAVGEESRSKDSRRMQRLREQADSAKAQDLTHQVEAQHTTHDGAVAAATSGFATAERHAVNGYGDQSEVVQQRQSTGEEDDSRREANGVENETALTENITGAVEETGDLGTSSYPDPSVFIRQRIGMGYYEQDDTPDKILFDPYQVPSADVMKLPESDVPEFVKKSIRAAKRKARRENEDPEFVIGRSHHKKPRLTQQPDLLDNMDPALFDGSDVQEAATNEPREAPEAQLLQAPETLQDKPERAPQRRQTMPVFDANEPILRHARPKASYVEVEDADLEEFEEENPGPRALPSTERPVATSGSEFGTGSQETRATAEAQVDDGSGRRGNHYNPAYGIRGGSNGQERQRTAEEVEPNLSKTDSTPPVEPTPQPKRRRGRPRRSEVSKQNASEEVPAKQKFMSMSERMALRGKSFKIGKRKSRGGASATVSKSMTPDENGDDALSTIGIRQQSPKDERGEVDRSRSRSADAEANQYSPSETSPGPRASGRGLGAKRESATMSGPTVGGSEGAKGL
ncbi:jmjC domain, hydroxylase domain-containing protein [Hirsutella rhossiliensis]|uniref:JmjC domain, hydroxylase domain-containing protein n=1 Tax=Hirsutella rhossiliensis TaxID=111463 RepID=A0A9P8SFF5_9HYPO|nr:jmjC domain, hydroxylase domain-containing protein [Hirsutella rhossiliensis]KAH0960691.1 jmjC domain, hydroxylase domain-containing protein [Hirsutella rhossiliensis]